MCDQPAIEATGICKSFGEGAGRTQVLSGVDIAVGAGECVFLVGPSGSGKSTLLSILGCILSPDEGRLQLLNQDASAWSEKQRARFRRHHIGFVFQRFQLFRGLRAWENVKVAFDLLGVSNADGRRRSLELLETLGMAERAEHHVTQLSMGQLQRIAIARALAGDPKLILADEPTASLDSANGRRSVELLSQLAQTGKAVLVVTHDDRIMPLADRIVRLEDGRVGTEELVRN